jgi:hypothetical protein
VYEQRDVKQMGHKTGVMCEQRDVKQMEHKTRVMCEQRDVKQMGHKTRVMCVLSALLTVLLNELQTNLMKCNVASVVMTPRCV